MSGAGALAFAALLLVAWRDPRRRAWALVALAFPGALLAAAERAAPAARGVAVAHNLWNRTVLAAHR